MERFVALPDRRERPALNPLDCTCRALLPEAGKKFAFVDELDFGHPDGVSRPQDRADIMRIVNPLENDGEPRLTMPENGQHFFPAALGQIRFPCSSNPRAAIVVPARRLEAKPASAASLIAGDLAVREELVREQPAG